MHYFVKHETLISSEKEDCHLILVLIGSDQFSFRYFDERDFIFIRALDLFTDRIVKLFQSQYQKPEKITIRLLQQSGILSDTAIDDPNDRRF